MLSVEAIRLSKKSLSAFWFYRACWVVWICLISLSRSGHEKSRAKYSGLLILSIYAAMNSSMRFHCKWLMSNRLKPKLLLINEYKNHNLLYVEVYVELSSDWEKNITLLEFPISTTAALRYSTLIFNFRY